MLGGVLNLALWRSGSHMDLERLRTLFVTNGQNSVELDLRLTLDTALHFTFWAVFAIAVMTVVVARLAPRVPVKTGDSNDGAEDLSVAVVEL